MPRLRRHQWGLRRSKVRSTAQVRPSPAQTSSAGTFGDDFDALASYMSEQRIDACGTRVRGHACCRTPKHLRLPDRRRRGPGHLLLEDNPPVFEEAALRGAPRCRRAVDVAGGRRDAARRAAWRVPTRPTAARSGWTRVTRQACVGLSPSVNRADNCGRAVRRGAACRARPWHSVDPAREHTCLRQSALSLPGWRRVPRVR